MKRISILSALVWLGSFGALLWQQLRAPAMHGRIDWLFVFIASTAFTLVVAWVARRILRRPTASNLAVMEALAHAPPGTSGVVMVTHKRGSSEVIATVRSWDEYRELLGTGQLPANHEFYSVDDFKP